MIDNWSYHGTHSHFPSSVSGSSYDGSSHLSILTSPSSVSSSLSDSHSHSTTPSPTPSTSSGKKTNAFFASPFASGSELQPPPPLTRSPSLASNLSQPFSRGHPDDDTDATPRLSSAPPPKSAGSLTGSFFNTSSFDSRPTPPPSVRSFTHGSAPTSPEASPPSSPPPARTRLPPLSRLFPSRFRYNTVDDLPSHEGYVKGHPPIPDPLSPKRRQFVDIREEGRIAQTDSPEDLSRPLPDVPHWPTLHEDRSQLKTLNVLIPPAAGTASLPTPISISQASPPPTGPAPALRAGDIVSEAPTKDVDRHSEDEHDGALRLELLRTLGQGAFSSVWLARDVSGRVGSLEVVRKSSLRRSMSKSSMRKGSLKRKKSSLRKRIEGAVPKVQLEDGESFGEGERLGSQGSLHEWFKEQDERLWRGRGDEDNPTRRDLGRVVALKMTDRSLCDRDDRSKVSFVREVEVLKHISHPSIVSYIHAFSTPAYHILVLEHVSGGELFDLVSNQELHAQLDEPLLRRIFGELCRAVSWMHAVGLVHRDIKLENILLTRPVFSEYSPAPLVKLTDFGLSRFIDPASPLLTTRCGSESYAAPELVIGRPYDGRDTDAWACGIVLYVLTTRRLPFDAIPTETVQETMHHEGHASVAGGRVRGPRRDERAERKALLMRIAKGEYTWPASSDVSEPLHGTALAQSDGLRRVVGRLLVRDPRKRTRVAQLWDDEWFAGEGAPPAPTLPDSVMPDPVDDSDDPNEPGAWDDTLDEDDIYDVVEEDDVADGVLVDGDDIGPDSVARREH